LTIVGEVSNKHHQTYYKFVSNYLLKNNIRNVDLKINVPYKDVSNFYSQNDIFILASKRELASISILEALSNGLLVISTKYNGSNCYLDKNFSFIFDVKNYNSLQPIFKELTKDRSKLKYLALSGKNRFLKNYSNNVFLSSFYKTTSKYVILKG
jgi:glycosyltransferase involved in cell wall biosynthesis